MKCRSTLLFASALLFFPVLSLAQASPAPSTQAQIAALQQSVQNAQMNADNAWMLVSAALVLLMTGPGLALFYGGLVRRKNILGTMMQSFAMMCLVTILWAVLGYSLAFGHGNAFIGGFEHVFLRGVGLTPNTDYAATIPEQTYMIYQLMFAIITPALITGAFAERMKFSAMALFLSLWSLLVYSPMAHMVWGVGGLLNANGGHIPSLDFAGGTVVHITSGVSALVTALYLGKRIGYPHTKMSPHSLVLSFIGACLLWVGWFGFNAGSALGSGPLATSAFVNTHFATATAALGWTIFEWLHNGKPTALGAISGAVAGLVAITPASGFVQPFAALLIGLLAGVLLLLHGLQGQDRSSATTTRSTPSACTAPAEPSALCSPASSPRNSSTPSSARRRPDRRHRRPLAPDPEPGSRSRHRLGHLHRRHPRPALRRRQGRRSARLARTTNTKASTSRSTAKKATTSTRSSARSERGKTSPPPIRPMLRSQRPSPKARENLPGSLLPSSLFKKICARSTQRPSHD